MKKLLAGFIILIVISLAGIYLFIPSQLTVSDFETVQCSLSGANRVLSLPENWKKLWHNDSGTRPASSSQNDPNLIYNGDTFRVAKVLQNTLMIIISGNKIQAESAFALLPLTQDSIAVNWTFNTTTSGNPIKRIQQYNEAVRLKTNMALVLKNVKEFLARNELVYGFTVTEVSTRDTMLISTKKEFTSQPSIEDIYGMINTLQVYAVANHARQTNAPMINVTYIDNNKFVAMTALPIDKELTGSGDISYKRMIPGKFLTTTVTGDNQIIENTQKGMQQYFQDYGRVAMAIPFMYLITDRRKEVDSSKWVTKLYYPVM